MAKTQIEKSHEKLIGFLKRVIASSDKIYGAARRSHTAQRHYDEAVRLVADAEKIKSSS